MSSDARIWQDEKGNWHAIHDGPCRINNPVHHPFVGTVYDLSEAIKTVEQCLEQPLAWELRPHTQHDMVLDGYLATRR